MSGLYTPEQMLAMIKNQVRPDAFLRGKLINMPVNLSDSTNIEIDEEEVAQGVSAYNARTGESVEVAKDGYTSRVHVAPYVDEQITMTPKDVDTRMPGQTIYEGSAASRAATKTDQFLRNLGDRLDRLEEKQISEIIQTGTVTVQNTDTGVNYTVDYNLPTANKATLSGTGVWGGTASDIKGNLQSWSKVLSNRGYVARDLVLDQDAANLLIADTEIQGLLDNRRIEIGGINIELLADQRANYIGRLMIPGLTIDVWSYFGGYQTDASTFVNYLTQYRAVLLGSGFQIQPHYGKIENFKANFVGRRFPMIRETDDGKRRYVSVQSSPLMVGRHMKAIFSAIVKS